LTNNASKYQHLRKEFAEFIYESYEYSVSGDKLNIRYNFHIPLLGSFSPGWEIGINRLCENRESIDKSILDNLVFSLGMAELVSYWKATCSPNVMVKCFFLSGEAIAWWKKLYLLGLGEFFYVNHINPGQDFVNIETVLDSPGINNSTHLGNTKTGGCPKTQASKHSSQKNAAYAELTDPFAHISFHIDGLSDSLPVWQKDTQLPMPTLSAPSTSVLVPIGGGKDSAVTLELLSRQDIYSFVINPRKATDDIIMVAQIASDRQITAKRHIDPNLLKLNQAGYLNGHTPFSAIVAFSSVLVAYLSGISFVALSNESSANEPTLSGGANHQYSKSFEFERDFVEYEQAFLKSGVKYFSLLRPFTELKIARIFSRHEKYLGVFRSCNAGSKSDIWCGNCPKCLFVYIILSPFLSQDKLIAMFGKDLLNDLCLSADFERLSGIVPEKPFECVGSRSEVVAAVSETIRTWGKLNPGREMPALFLKYGNSFSSTHDGFESLLNSFDENNLIPNSLIESLRIQ